MRLTDQLLTVAQLYADARKLSASRVSTIVFGDGKIISRINDGADITTRRLEGAMAWFSSNWPDDVVWPETVQRPAASKLAEAG